jgi:tetratricopeptide (TPR) repeat protein
MRSALTWAIILAASAMSVVPARTQPSLKDTCLGIPQVKPEERISACSALIESGAQQHGLAYQQRAFLRMQAGDYDGALSDFNDAIRLEPTAWSYIGRADVWQLTNDRDRAIADFSEAIRLEPGNVRAFSGRAANWVVKKEFDRAIADFDKVIRLQPKDASLRVDRGDVWQRKGDLDRAIADYDEALRLDPKSLQGLAARGLAWREKGDLDRAMADFDEAVRAAPDWAGNYLMRSDIWYRKGNLDRALADCGEGIRREQMPILLTIYHQFCAQEHFFKGDLAAAADELKRSLELTAGADAMLWLFLVRGRAGTDGAAELAANAEKLKAKDWPAAVIEFYLGKRPAEAMLARPRQRPMSAAMRSSISANGTCCAATKRRRRRRCRPRSSAALRPASSSSPPPRPSSGD